MREGKQEDRKPVTLVQGERISWLCFLPLLEYLDMRNLIYVSYNASHHTCRYLRHLWEYTLASPRGRASHRTRASARAPGAPHGTQLTSDSLHYAGWTLHSTLPQISTCNVATTTTPSRFYLIPESYLVGSPKIPSLSIPA